MDPRPYNFEFRKPRLENRTYQSSKFSGTIFKSPYFKNDQPTQSIIRYSPIKTPKSEPVGTKRNQSFDLPRADKVLPNDYDVVRKDRRPPSNLAQLGGNLMKNPLEQNKVYEKQQKAFNIINGNLKSYSPHLKNYPWLTVEDRLIERKQSSFIPKLQKKSQT